MTIGGALSELNNLLKADDIPFYYKPSIKKVIETITMEIKPMPQEQCEDCISREAVENAIKHGEVNFTVNSDIDFTKHKREVQEIVNGIIDAQIKALRDLPSVTPQKKMGSSSEKPNKWISLDEREPKDGQLVLVTLVNRYKQRYVKIAEFIEEDYRKHDGEIDQRYFGFHSYGGVYNVYDYADEAVAWMPLPPQYQPEIPTVAEGSEE